MGDPIKDLYNSLKGSGLFVDEADFRNQLTQAPKDVFGLVAQDGLFLDYADFETTLNLKKKGAGAPLAPPAPAAGGPSPAASPSALPSSLSSEAVLLNARVIRDARSRIRQAQNSQGAPVGGSMVPMSTSNAGPSTFDLAEEKESAGLLKAAGYNPDEIVADFADVPYYEGFSVDEALKLKKENPQRYQRTLAAQKWQLPVYQAISEKAGDTAPDLINTLRQGQAQKNRAGVRASMRQSMGAVSEFVDDPLEQKRLRGLILQDKAFGYGIIDAEVEAEIAADPRSQYLNRYQVNYLHFLEDVDPQSAEEYTRLISVEPSTPDGKRGRDIKLRDLERQGMGLTQKAVEERLTQYTNRVKAGEELSEGEKDDYVSLYQQYQDLQQDARDQAARYPNATALDADALAQEAIGQANNPGKKFVLGVGENVGDAVNWLGDMVLSPFRSSEAKAIDDLEDLGEKKAARNLTYTTQKNTLVSPDYTHQFAPELQKQLDAIQSNATLSDGEKRDRARTLILQNPDGVSFIPNKDGGKFNVTASAWANAVSEVGSQIAAQAGLAFVTGGAGNLSKLGQARQLFMTTFASAYNDYYTEALEKGVSNPSTYATVHTTIEAATELVNNDLAAAKKLFRPGTAAADILNGVTKEQWDLMTRSGKGRFLAALGRTTKGALNQTKGETFEEVLGQITGNVADNLAFGQDTDLGEGLKETFTNTILGTLPLGFLGLGGQIRSINRSQAYALAEAGQNPDKFLTQLEKDVAAGIVDDAQAGKIKSAIEKAAAAYKKLKPEGENGQPLTDNQKAEALVSVILPKKEGEGEKRGPVITIAPKKQETTKPSTAVILPAQNKPAPVTTIAPKEVKTEAKADTRPTVILPSANKAPSVTTVSPQSPSSAPMVNGAAQRGEMQGETQADTKGSDAYIETRMMDLEDKIAAARGTEESRVYQEEFNTLEKEMEKRERDSVFSAPLENVGAAVDALMQKEKTQPNGYGSFIERQDARETKEVADRYIAADKLSDEEVKGDFKEALMGRPATWYSDGLKLREAARVAAERGIDIDELLAEVEKEFIKDGYDSATAKSVIAGYLAPVFKGGTKVETNEARMITPVSPQSPSPTPRLVESERGALEKGETQEEITVESVVKRKQSGEPFSEAEQAFYDANQKAVMEEYIRQALAGPDDDARPVVKLADIAKGASIFRGRSNGKPTATGFFSPHKEEAMGYAEENEANVIEMTVKPGARVLNLIKGDTENYSDNQKGIKEFVAIVGKDAVEQNDPADVSESLWHKGPTVAKLKKAGIDVVVARSIDGPVIFVVNPEAVSEKGSPISPSKKEQFREAILTALESANGSEFSEVISDIALQDSDRKTAVKNIRKGKSTVATKKVEEAIEKMWADGYVYLNRGRGDHAESYQMPIAEFLERISQNDEAFQDLSRQAQNLQASLDALGEDLFTDAETIITEVNNESPQSNELKTPSTPSQDTGTPQTPATGSNEANRTTGSPASDTKGNKEQKTGVDRFEAQEVIPYRSVEDNTYKPEEQLKFNQGQYFEAVRLVGEPDLIELIQIGSRRHYNLTHSSGKKPVNEARQKQLEDQFGVSAYELYQKAREMAKANRSKTDEVIVVIGEKGSPAPKATPKQKKAGTYEAKARKLAKKLDNMKMPDWFSVKDPNVKKMGLDAESMKKAFKAIIIDTGILLDKGVGAGEALRRGAEAMVAFVEEGYKKIGGKLKPEAAEAIRAGFTRDAAQIFGITGDGTPPADATIEEDDPSNPTRRFSRRVLKDDTILKGVKPGVEAAMEYTRQTNAMSVQEASEVINRVGADDAYDLVVNDKGLKPAVRVVLGQMLIKKYNQMAEEAAAAGDTERENRYLDKTIDVANYVSEKFGTEAGQMIQALSLFERLTPEAQLRAAQKEVKAIGKKKAEKRRKDIEEVGKKLQAANEEAAEELTQSPKVKKAVEKTETERVKKAKDKIEAARKKREALIKKYRGDKGKNLYSSLPGLTPEGIEFVGNLVATYIQEGVARLEILTDNVLRELRAVTGKEPSEGVVKGVRAIVQAQLDQTADRRIAQGVKELEREVGRIIREHYTVTDAEKKKLVDKFMEGTGLDKAEALALAQQVEEEFARIATRKKRELLLGEKGRLQKIQRDLDRTGAREYTTLQDEIVKYSNLGALDSAEFFDMVAQKLGVGRLTEAEARDIKRLAEAIQKAPEGSPRNEATQDLLAYRANLRGVNAMELAQAVWYANILSGYKTHLVNVVSTFINGVGAFAAEAARSPRSIPVMFYGGLRGMRRGLFEAAHTVRTGRSPIHIKKVETPTTLERHHFAGLLRPLNWAKYVGRLMAAEDVLLFQGLKEMRATQLAYREAQKAGHRNPFGRQTWAVIEKTLLNTQARSAEAMAQAEGEGFTRGTVPWKRRVYELMELSRPITMTEEAYGFAARGTFNHPPEGWLGAITNAVTPLLDIEVNGMRPVRWLIPFTRIITNVVNSALDYTPVGAIRALRGRRGAEGFADKSWTGGAFKELTREERAQIASKAALGILTTAALYALTYVDDEEGHPLIEITAAGTGNFERDEQLKQRGWQPYSVKIGGRWISYKYTPLLFNLSLIGYLKDQEAYGGDDEETMGYKVMLAAFQTGQQALEGTFVGSTSALMETVSEDNPAQIAKGAGATGGKLATQTAVPNLYIQGAQAYEAVFALNQKDARGAFQRLQQHIPVARNRMFDKVNALGEPIPTDVDVFVSSAAPHPVFEFLHGKKAWVARVNPNTFMLWDAQKGEERLGTPDEYYRFAQLRGQKIKTALEEVIRYGAYVRRNDRGEEVVTASVEEAEDSRAARDLTSQQVKDLVRLLSTRASIEAKKELFGGGW